MRYSLTGDLELSHCEAEAHKEKTKRYKMEGRFKHVEDSYDLIHQTSMNSKSVEVYPYP